AGVRPAAVPRLAPGTRVHARGADGARVGHRPHRGRALDRQSGEPAAPQDRARPREPAASADGVGRRLPLRRAAVSPGTQSGAPEAPPGGGMQRGERDPAPDAAPRGRHRSLFWTFAGVFLLVLGAATALQFVTSVAVLRPLSVSGQRAHADLAVTRAAQELA